MNYIFETSWEVCNKVGGIYTVLSSRALTMQTDDQCEVMFIGPDVWHDQPSPYFKEDATLMTEWGNKAKAEGLKIKIGRWIVPGNPIAVLVDFTPFFEQKDEIYAWGWREWQVDSLHAYGDYDEASMFSIAAAKVAESYIHFALKPTDQVIYHANEWMTGLGLLYMRSVMPQVATIFTTHATSIGRSIAGNNKLLYKYFYGYNGNQMADELNMQSKHSIERQTAHACHCFTTVSDITARECKQLLDKPVDVVLPNGFDDSFVPHGAEFTRRRKMARKQLFNMATSLTGRTYTDANTMIVSTSGRYEFRNKGIDMFIDSIDRLRNMDTNGRHVLALILVPGWTAGPRTDLAERMSSDSIFNTPLPNPIVTHDLRQPENDPATNMMRYKGINNEGEGNVTLIFVPTYLTGNDGIVNLPYYDVLSAADMAVYPSYYEPWGYTPLEAVAFHVPCITTDLTGFGLWANSVRGHQSVIAEGVETIHRDDENYQDCCNRIAETISQYAAFDAKNTKRTRDAARSLSQKALWSKFFKYYREAYKLAIDNCNNQIR